MARLVYNNQSGLLGAPLTNVGTTITFATAPNFATLTGSDYIPLILSPATPNFEIVYLTAYTALATTGTITRAAEDGAHWPAVAHSDSWVCGPNINDVKYNPGAILGSLKYDPAGNTNFTLGSVGAVVQVTGSGALTVPFIVPPSGSIIWRFDALMAMSSAGVVGFFQPYIAAVGLVGSLQYTLTNAAAIRLSVVDIITGLTPFSSYSVEPAYTISTSGNLTIFSGGSQGAIIQTVQAL